LITEPGKDLIKKCQKGDLESFKILYKHYEKTIFGFCYRMLNNKQDAEDAVQTIFLNLYRSFSKFRFKARFTTYLFSITRNVCYDLMKEQKIKKEDLEEIVQTSANNYPMDQDIAKAISLLPEKTRECFVLFAIEGYPQDEIANLLNIKIGTVKALIFQARKKLVTWLSDEEEQLDELSEI
jgi:RNA polymerase sigma-70 factor (ECF subfamily)